MRRFQVANILQSRVNFDRFRAPRSIEASASIESASKNERSIPVAKSTGRQQTNVRSPTNAMRGFLYANILQRKVNLDRVKLVHKCQGRECSARSLTKSCVAQLSCRLPSCTFTVGCRSWRHSGDALGRRGSRTCTIFASTKAFRSQIWCHRKE